MPSAYLSLSSNLGDRLSFIKDAIKELARAGEIKKISSMYETEPWGRKEQPWFINACLEMEIELTPDALLRTCLEIERKLGRVRFEHWGTRIIDIDILFYDGRILETDSLQIPHPQIEERRFVLAPLNEIAPNLIHPKLKKSIKDLLKECADPSIVKLAAPTKPALHDHTRTQKTRDPVPD